MGSHAIITIAALDGPAGPLWSILSLVMPLRVDLKQGETWGDMEYGDALMDTVRAKVFVSCGQATGQERRTAEDVADQLFRLGFDPYIAVQEKTLRDLKANIFARLADSEYFLFIDFRREQLASGEFRGSLFSHQGACPINPLPVE